MIVPGMPNAFFFIAELKNTDKQINEYGNLHGGISHGV